MSVSICRWGILSTAVIAQKNWKAIELSGNGKVVAVASRTAHRAQEFIDARQHEFPIESPPTAYGSYEELIADDGVDAVYIPLPTGLRKPWVIAAAQAGKHVMCEKPCAVSAADLAEMIDACAENNVQFMDGVMFMHSDRLQMMREVLDDGNSIGDLKRIGIQFSFNAAQEFMDQNIRTTSELEPQGALGDLGWYCIRFCLWANHFQLPESVCGRILTDLKRDDSPDSVPLEFSAELFWPDGVSASFYCSFITTMQQWAVISGTKGYLRVNDFVLPYYGNQLHFDICQASFEEDGCDFRMEDFSQRRSAPEHGNSSPTAQESKLFRRFNENVLKSEIESHWPRIAMMTQQTLDACLDSARNGSLLQSINADIATAK